MTVVINCTAIIHSNVVLSKSAADTHRDGCNSLLFLLPLLKLLVHDTALNKNLLGSSSLVIILNNPAGKISDTLYCAKNTRQYTFK